jgi:hypothetical protein
MVEQVFFPLMFSFVLKQMVSMPHSCHAREREKKIKPKGATSCAELPLA